MNSSNHPPIFDWTRNPPPPNLTPFQQFTRHVDWEKSPLGPMDQWSSQLRQTVLMMIADPNPVVLYWGEEMTTIYNEAYVPLIGPRHPVQGQDPKLVFPDIWHHFDKIIREGMRTGKAHVGENQLLPFNRFGYLEETYFNWKFLPMIGEEGYVIASYVIPTEVTREVISDRRMRSLRQLGVQMNNAKSMREFWTGLLRGMEPNKEDMPLLMLYSTDSSSPRRSPAEDDITCALECCLGIHGGHPAAPQRVRLSVEATGLSAIFRNSITKTGPVLFKRGDPLLPYDMFDGVSWRGFGVPCEEFLACDIRSGRGSLIGFMFIGLNPWKRFDSDFLDFITLINEQITSPHVSALLLAEEIRRSDHEAQLAAIQRAELSNQLLEMTRDYEHSELRYRNFAHHAPLGVALVNADGYMKYMNEAWFTLTSQDRNDLHPRPWLKTVHPDDVGKIDAFFDDLLNGGGPLTIETRLNRPYTVDGEEAITDGHSAWILASGYAEMDGSGSFHNVVCWITDISAQKAAARGLTIKMEEALELKKQRENFIDMISHEVRNPLSAVMHCSEDIANSLSLISSVILPQDHRSMESIQNAIENANTIAYCVQHQKRIIDDVLTLSKLDSSLLTICPVVTKPVGTVRAALKLFEQELSTGDIHMDIVEDDSLHEMKIDYALLDPSRFLQVLINLATNAIKFTRNHDVRRVTIHLSASMDRPTNCSIERGIKFLPSHPMSRQRSCKLNDNYGQPFYFSVAVSDTGKGLSQSEQTRLFRRFEQGSPKTYVKYGGSGLGLWISRGIVEMMGGDIGVASEGEGKGSTFFFYIQAQRAPKPANENDDAMNLERNIPSMALGSNATSATVELLPPQQVENTIEIDESATKSVPSPKLERSKPSQQAPQAERRPSKVLVVEDNLINQRVLSRSLKSRGYVVAVANHGFEALARLYETSAYKGDSAKATRSHSPSSPQDTQAYSHSASTSPQNFPFPANNSRASPRGTSRSRRSRPSPNRTTSVTSTTSINLNRSRSHSTQPSPSETMPKEPPFDVILLDVEMPHMNGITCIRQIRSLESQGLLEGHTAVVAVTANVRTEQIKGALEAGMDGVTSKPYRMDELLGEIERVWNKVGKAGEEGTDGVGRDVDVDGDGDGGREKRWKGDGVADPGG
ncbi:hypothetical protein K402DRAFT_424545 [Aulographum hederae CBS 113979]|uniref:Uncharacterized protein n=1 Tax=Aulographum hederae CBS 113979 TaxID=1176131 RepID=A0A6G1GNV2_9PEZI|nr:hypothetical protein K402DRAFT_424545 [Aulographum hederae CBS 113979]